MALNYNPESSKGILDAIKGSMEIFGPTNKDEALGQDPQSAPQDEYESSMNERDVLEMASLWRREYGVYYKDIEPTQKLAFEYWVNRQRNQDDDGNKIVPADNLIFEAVETFLPIATRNNPDPLVNADPSDIGQSLAKDIRVALVNWADTQQFRRKLARMTRKWLLDRIGVLKLTWDVSTKTIELSVINGKRMMFDPRGSVNEKGIFTGEWLGEEKKASASKLMEMFPRKRSEILQRSRGKMGSEMTYCEWWYRGRDIFYTLGTDILLGKFKNPNWNYNIPAQPDQEAKMDEQGNMLQEPLPGQPEVEAVNHLNAPNYPYLFLSIFNIGEKPHDETSLILQNIPLQDTINRREVQIEHNVKNMNNGMVVSGDYYTEEQAAQANTQLRKGNAVRQPRGNPSEGTHFPQRPGLQPDVFKHLEDSRAELRNIFGTSGSSPQGLEGTDTVRGKILINQLDSSRIGGGITEQIEQIADSVYNLVVQFMFVYYDEEHYITATGSVSGMELVVIKNTAFPLLQTLDITVKEGSLIPKDPLTQRNEAMDLWQANAIDPLSLYKKLDFPNAEEAANQLILWQMFQKGQIPPNYYLPNFQANIQQQQQAQQGAQVPPPGQIPGQGEQPPPEQQLPEQDIAHQLISEVPLPKK